MAATIPGSLATGEVRSDCALWKPCSFNTPGSSGMRSTSAKNSKRMPAGARSLTLARIIFFANTVPAESYQQRDSGSRGVQLDVAELSALGVRRISVGSALCRAALGAFLRAARETRERGTFSWASEAANPWELTRIFGPKRQSPYQQGTRILGNRSRYLLDHGQRATRKLADARQTSRSISNDSFRIAAPYKFVNAEPLHATNLVAVLSTGISDNSRIAPHSYFHR